MHTLYIGNKNYSSWSLRPWILLKELDIAFEEKLVPFGDVPGYPAFSSFSPTAKVPCLHDGQTVVWESIAIVEYLAERHPEVWPKDPKARAWARSAAAEMHAGFSTLRNICTMNCGIRVELKERPEALKKDIERIAQLWSEGLARFGGPFLAGSTFTAVDAFFCPVAFRVQTYGLELPGLAGDYAKRLLELKGMKAWYEAGLKETWRDEPHEEEVKTVGRVTRDLRASAAVTA